MRKFIVSNWLFLSSISALWLFVLAILGDITEEVVNSESIINFDKYFAALFLNWRTDFGIEIFRVITFLANLEFALPLAALVLVFLIIKKYRTFVWPFALTILSAELTTLIGKIIIERVRPEDGALVMLDFSFPSGHATIAMALYGFLAYLIITQIKKKSVKVAVFLVAVTLILVIGFSRLYLGVHYVSDVLAGYLVGLLALLSGISLRAWFKYQEGRRIGVK